jgi:hypothetical protein
MLLMRKKTAAVAAAVTMKVAIPNLNQVVATKMKFLTKQRIGS